MTSISKRVQSSCSRLRYQMWQHTPSTCSWLNSRTHKKRKEKKKKWGKEKKEVWKRDHLSIIWLAVSEANCIAHPHVYMNRWSFVESSHWERICAAIERSWQLMIIARTCGIISIWKRLRRALLRRAPRTERSYSARSLSWHCCRSRRVWRFCCT